MSKKEGDSKPTLWQSCYILHKRNRYFIVHFKQLFLLDGRYKRTIYTEDDANRTKLIAMLLKRWGLVEPIKPLEIDDKITDVVVISYSEKQNWNLVSKYTIGKFKINSNEDFNNEDTVWNES